jgi:benzylsuccinate CoA-transferase BbsF subunit
MCGYEGEPPRPPGGTFADFVAGTTIVFATLLAYRGRRLTGKGAHIDLSMAEGTMALMGEAFTRYFLTGYVPTTRGNDLAAAAPWGSYRCAGDDKWIAIAISTDDQWRRLVDAIGAPDWTARFGGVEARRSGAAELDRLITDWTHVQDNLELAELLQARGVPAVPSSDPEDILRNPHFAARLLREQPSSPVRDNLIQNLPWHFTAFPELDGRIPAAPLLGQDNAAIFSRLQSSSPPLIAEIEEALRLRMEQDATKEAARLQSNQ